MVAGITGVVIRPVVSDDLDGIERLLCGLSPDARYRRWFSAAVDLVAAAHWAVDGSGALGFVAVSGDDVVGHGTLVPSRPGCAEVAFEVAEPWRRHGIATQLLAALEEHASEMGIETIEADVLSFNADMLGVFAAHGDCTRSRDGTVVHVTFPAHALAAQAWSSSPRSSA
jgi:GNAT superfamily N-acetyltransferase